jgi:Ni/Fe-hydrogenase subunit HybB-like protein
MPTSLPSNGWVFPNDIHPPWSIMIVIYPYLTGLVAGAFVVSALYHVFHIKALAPVSRLALVAATCFCACAGLPLQLHLHHPEHSYLIFVTPSTSSAMVMFGLIYNAYLLLLFVEMWLVFRPTIVERANGSKGILRLIYRALCLGSYEITPKSRALDEKAITILSFVGIPAACLLHGYVGFLFGAIKANPWWSTALMPVIFLASAIVSGIAALIVVYLFLCWRRKLAPEVDCVQTMVKYLWGFLCFAVALEVLEIVHMAYEGGEEWPILSQLIFGRLKVSYVWIQVIVGSLVPFLLLPVAMMPRLAPKTTFRVAGFASLLVLLQVLVMRWNVVVGGQSYSKSFRGFVDYVVHVPGREGLITATVVLCLPLVLMWGAIKVVRLPLQLEPEARADAE